ncbi:MAG TPA: DUF4197 domain-containing protein [Burkholderiales bacterium]|nr:DUF4197 domain-containing protein [Burkholderiales bacterium]
MRRIFAFFGLLVLPAAALALGIEDLSNRDAAAGLKEALTKGAGEAVNRLGVENGFFGDGRVKILMPESMKKTENLMRRLGMGKQADELILRMNRAAEAAVPEARAVFVDSIKAMSVADARSILSGGDDAATQYFRRTMSDPLAQRFHPIVVRAMDKVRLAESWDRFASRASRLGWVKPEDANLEDYVTRRALDGLFLMIAEEEKRIRANPAQEASSILRKVFGALIQH